MALAQRLDLKGPAVVKEVARHVMETQGYSRKDVGSLKMQQAILEAHLKEEKKGWGCPIQLSDRSAIDPIVYAVLTSPDENEAQRRREILVNSPDFKNALPRYRRSTFILLAPVADWLKDDGVRLLEHQARCFEVFRQILVELGIPFLEIGAQMRFLEERVTMVMGLMKL
jgi:nicotinamide riboside kinase